MLFKTVLLDCILICILALWVTICLGFRVKEGAKARSLLTCLLQKALGCDHAKFSFRGVRGPLKSISHFTTLHYDKSVKKTTTKKTPKQIKNKGGQDNKNKYFYIVMLVEYI